MDWYFQVLSKYAVFSGRARRQEYWMFILFHSILSIGLTIAAILLDYFTCFSIEDVSYVVVYLSYGFAIFIPYLAVTVRRLHDTGKSSWMLLITLIPIIGHIWLLVVMIMDSEPGDNKYGPEPGGISEDNVLIPEGYLSPLDKVFNILISITGWIAFGILVLLLLSNFVNIYSSDNFFGLSREGLYDLQRLLLSFFIILGLSYTAKHDGHMIVNIGIAQLSEDTRKIFKGIIYIISLELILVITVELFMHGKVFFTVREMVTSFHIPLYPIVFLFSFGFVLFGLIFIYKLIDTLKYKINGRHFFFWLWLILFLTGILIFLLNMNRSSEIIGMIGLTAFFIFIFIGMPVGLALILVGFIGFGSIVNWSTSYNLLSTTWLIPSDFRVLIIPFLILITSIMQRSGILQSLSFFLINCFSSFSGGKVSGGFVAFFVGSFGVVSSQTSVGGIGNIVLLQNKKDDKNSSQSSLIISSIAAGSIVSMLIPPSLALVIFGLICELPISTLFLGGLSAGLVVFQIFVLYFFIIGFFNPGSKAAPAAVPGNQIAAGIISILFITTIIFVFIAGTLFYERTVIELSGIIVLLTIFLGIIHTIVIKRSVFKMIFKSLHQTVYTTGMILLVLIGAVVFGHFIAMTKLPLSLAGFISSFSVNPHIILLIILLIYLGLSCFIEALTLMVLCIPSLFLTFNSLGFDMVWLGVIITIISGIGMLLPPGGRNLKIIRQLKKTYQTKELVMGIAPVIFLMFIIMGLLMIFPQIVTFLPNLLW